MKKFVWTAAAALGLACMGVVPAAAQGAPRTQRQQVRTRVERRVDRRFKKLDANGNGVIDRSEWTRKSRVFDRFDRNHDGALSPEEFRRLVIRLAGRRVAKGRR